MSEKSQRIAVLGAGPMGLAVAYQLVLDGHHPVVFEADDRVGGMTACMDFSGLRIERYYHFHCTSDQAFLHILGELGISDRMRWVATKMGYWHQGKVQAWGTPMALLRFEGLGLIPKLRYALHAFASIKRNDWHDLDDVEATGWIRRWVGEEAWDVLWHKLFALKFYDYTSQLSAAWIWSRIRRIGRSRYNVFKEKLGYLEGGSDVLLNAMKAAIEARGGIIRLGTPVQKVVIRDGAVNGIDVGKGVESFDKVVSTVPVPFVARLIPDLPVEILNQFQAIRNIAVVCVIATLRKPVTKNFWLNVNDPEMDIPGIVEYSNLRPLDRHVVYVPFYMPGEHPKFADANEVFLEKVRNYIKRINPNVTDEDFIDMRASRYRFAQPICGPGYLRGLPPVKLPVAGLWVADTSYYYPEDRGISESIGFGRSMAKAVAS